jgi:hypothetical protein
MTRPVTESERRLLAHVSLFGSDGYPVRKCGRSWHWDAAFGVPGAPTVYRTKREAIAAFERFLDVLREALGTEARAKALRDVNTEDSEHV